MPELKGILTATTTPFRNDGTVDLEGYSQNMEYQLSCGVDGFLVNGSTGEAVSMNENERKEILECAVSTARGRGTILVGVVTETTDEAIRLSKHAEAVGADAVLVAPSGYCRCDARMIQQHISVIANSVSLPVVLYNNFYATNTDIPASLMIELLEKLPNALYIKECSFRSLERMKEIRLGCSREVNFICGWDNLALETFFNGAQAWTSICANTAPSLCCELFKLSSSGHWAAAWKIYDLLLQYIHFYSSPNMLSFLKYAHELLGNTGGTSRGPRLELTNEEKMATQDAVKKLGILH